MTAADRDSAITEHGAMAENAHAQQPGDVLKALRADAAEGLSPEEAEHRLHQYGPNEIRQQKAVSPLTLFLQQLKSPLIGILLAAAAIAALLGEAVDAIVIAAIVLANALLGFVQEYRAERTIASLQRLAAPRSKVLRAGRLTELESRLLVPGDIIFVETGDRVAADARLLETVNLQAEEASLTGESLPSDKQTPPLKKETPVADRSSMLFAGTTITRGRGKAAVTATGMTTQFGRIAQMIQEAPPEITPLQQRMGSLARWLGIAAIVVVLITFGIGVARGHPLLSIFLVAISLAVAVVPEGLPILMTISLAFGVRRMAKRNALIRRLSSVETLGTVSVICTDKTGTLTRNEMTVRKLWVGGSAIDVTGSGYTAAGTFTNDGAPVDAGAMPALRLLLTAGALCSNTRLGGEDGKVQVIGDPTEAALIVSAAKAGLKQEELSEKYPRRSEIEFTSERKRMSIVCSMGRSNAALMKGAPDVVLARCDRVLTENGTVRLTRALREGILEANERFGRSALRVLGFAYKEHVSSATRLEDVEEEMVFLGLQAMIDPPRDEAKEAVARCARAGIRVMMITGDHKATALAVAREIGITGEALSGEELERMGDRELKQAIGRIGIFARVDPEHKTRIISALKAQGHVVAMTGDGINDAPALKNADVGIAMGITGTDVAKEASDMVLTDDNFASIVNAVEEGRTVYDNIRAFLAYLLSGNYGELLSVLLAITVGLPLPLLALQILWINVVTETIPATALSKEPPEHDLMERPPRKKHQRLFQKRELAAIGATMLLIALGTLAVFYLSLTDSGWTFGEALDPLNPGREYRYALTMAFVTFVFFQLFNIFNAKSPGHTVFFEELTNNRWMLGAVLLTVLLQLAVVYVPALNGIFGTVPLAPEAWVLAALVASSVLWGAEAVKLFRRLSGRRPAEVHHG